jgi:hypothetical protein
MSKLPTVSPLKKPQGRPRVHYISRVPKLTPDFQTTWIAPNATLFYHQSALNIKSNTKLLKFPPSTPFKDAIATSKSPVQPQSYLSHTSVAAPLPLDRPDPSTPQAPENFLFDRLPWQISSSSHLRKRGLKIEADWGNHCFLPEGLAGGRADCRYSRI